MDYLNLLRISDLSGLKDYLKINSTNQKLNGQTLLFWAVYHNNLSFTQILIQHGANPNIKDVLGRTALQTACFFGFYEIIKFLLENGAIVDDTCFERASKGWDNNYQTETIELLRQHLH